MIRKALWIAVTMGALGGAGCAGAGDGGGGGGPDASLGAQDMIDDLEDGDDAIAATNGRQGNWYTFHDMTATGMQMPTDTEFTPMSGGAESSKYAAGTTGSGFTDWGAGMGFDLNATETTRSVYDASKYKTLVFKAKGNVSIRVALATAGTTPNTEGGTCTPSTTEGSECEDMHGMTFKLTADWKEYQVPFAQMTQEGWGLKVPFDAKTAMGVLFSVDANLQFDYAIDDVSFYE